MNELPGVSSDQDPSLEEKLSPESLRAATILLLATDAVLSDDMGIEQAVSFAERISKSLDTGMWSDGKHHGDCTRNTETCVRCYFEQYERIIKVLWESDDFIPTFVQICMEAMETPFD